MIHIFIMFTVIGRQKLKLFKVNINEFAHSLIYLKNVYCTPTIYVLDIVSAVLLLVK